MKRSTDRILTTHVGSLIRTPPIVEGFKAKMTHKPYDAKALDAEIHKGIMEVVRKQAEVGIDIPSDGEFSKPNFGRYIGERLSGVELRPAERGRQQPAGNSMLNEAFPGFMAQYNSMYQTMWVDPSISREGWEDEQPESYVTTGPIGYKGQAAVQEDIQTFREAMQGHHFTEAFITASVPSFTYPDPEHIYPTEEAYLEAVANAVHEEYQAIVDAGFLVQLDLGLPARTNPTPEARRNSEKQVEAYNHALRGIPEDRVRYHICWGSMNTPHTTDIPLREVIDLVLKVKAQAYSIEAANPRHEHEWMVWQDVKLPEGKILIPGIVSHQTNVVEHPELVAWRIKNFTSVVGRENVIAGTDCGFSQSYERARVHPEVQWAKLSALAEGAALASKDLWR
jgi:5-methyltetrahydropteroyltriglutamate--homocysteine methyltransferase